MQRGRPLPPPPQAPAQADFELDILELDIFGREQVKSRLIVLGIQQAPGEAPPLAGTEAQEPSTTAAPGIGAAAGTPRPHSEEEQ